MIDLYGNPMSTCTRKVLMTLGETNTPFEMHVVDFAKGEHKQDTHLRHQPFGRVPALSDGSFEMFESRAMCRYINEKSAGKLAPSTAQGRAKMEQWISIETSEFSPNAMKFVYQYVFKREQPPAVLEAAKAAVEQVCSVMEKELAKSAYLAGDELSLADICFMPYFEYTIATPLKEVYAKFPHVLAWWNKVSERPAWRKTTAN
jgi:glutathione S-transferase